MTLTVIDLLLFWAPFRLMMCYVFCITFSNIDFVFIALGTESGLTFDYFLMIFLFAHRHCETMLSDKGIMDLNDFTHPDRALFYGSLSLPFLH